MVMPGEPVETLRLAGDMLELLDQRRLPRAVEWVCCARAADTAEAIRAMVVRGAPAIGVTAAYGIALEAHALAFGAAAPAATGPDPVPAAVGAGARLPQHVRPGGEGSPGEQHTVGAAPRRDNGGGAAQHSRSEARFPQYALPGECPDAAFAEALEAGFATLAASRPTAVNLFWALDRMRRAWRDAGSAAPATVAEQLLAAAKTIHADDVAANRALGEHGAALLADGARVLTHCNAGALATAGHGTALGVVRSAVAAGKRIAVIADETRPFLQGARLTAWELQAEGIPVTLITDNMAGHLMAQGEIDAVVVGTDRVAANGDVANKIGTYMVAVLARHHGIPFYVACPLSTIDPAVADGRAIPIEERAPEEVTGYGGERWAPAGVAARHPAFDITPAALVTALVTEAGVVMQPDAVKIAALLAGGLRCGEAPLPQ